MYKMKKPKTLTEIFSQTELPLNEKSELDMKYKKAIEIIINAETIEESAFDIDDKKERDKVFAQLKEDRLAAYSIFEELGKAGYAGSLYKQGLCCSYRIAQKDGDSNHAKAAEYFKKAAELGYKEAKTALDELN